MLVYKLDLDEIKRSKGYNEFINSDYCTPYRYACIIYLPLFFMLGLSIYFFINCFYTVTSLDYFYRFVIHFVSIIYDIAFIISFSIVLSSAYHSEYTSINKEYFNKHYKIITIEEYKNLLNKENQKNEIHYF